jgi:RNA recognition motif-containing protein
MATPTPSTSDGDSDLSFEALTFGEDSGNIKKESKAAKKKSFKKDRVSAPQESEKDKNAASVYVSTKNDADKIDVQSLLKRLEQFGVVKASYFKEKQNFGFIQFLDASVVDVVVDNINKNPSFLPDGVQLIAEKATGKGAHKTGSPQSYGNSMGTSLGTSFGMPFSPSTPTGTTAATFAVSSPAQSPAPSTLASPAPAPVVEKPDTILVLKNLPFSLKQDQLQEILMAMNTTAPQSINLHFDNMGVFRGMAFIKYRSLDDAIKVYESLNGYDVGGRKVRVEYKRKNKGQQTDIPVEWQEEEDLKKLWEQVRDFSNNPNVNEISFTPNLTSNQRKQIHTMAEKLKLTHYSNGEGELRYICIKKTAPTPTPSSSAPSSSAYSTSASSTSAAVPIQNGFALPIPNGDARAIDIKGRRPRRDSENSGTRQLAGSPNGNHGGPVGSIEKEVKEYRSRGNSFKQKDVTSSAPSDVNLDWRVQSPQNPMTLPQSPSVAGCITIAPSRQPKGPDGSKGFSDLYRNARKHTCTFVPISDNSTPEIPAVV